MSASMSLHHGRHKTEVPNPVGTFISPNKPPRVQWHGGFSLRLRPAQTPARVHPHPGGEGKERAIKIMSGGGREGVWGCVEGGGGGGGGDVLRIELRFNA